MADHGGRARPAKIYLESRDGDVISPSDGRPLPRRAARYLRPCARTVAEAVGVPNTPLLSELFKDSPRWPCDVSFKSWLGPQKKWDDWVDRLAGKYSAVWHRAGICDAIMSSRYIIRCDKHVVLGLAEHWCPETNTFVFPWGEAAVTLEDVMILGGFSPSGDPVDHPVAGNLIWLVEEMNRVRAGLCKSSSKHAGYVAWLDHFMEREPKSQIEHVGFLSLWLSRFVFCLSNSVVKEVFPIAALLSSGVKISLGEAVLAGIYQSLRTLRERAMASSDSISGSGLLRLVQLWGFERFPLLGPKLPNLLKPGEPRAARWHKLSSKIDLKLVRTVLSPATNFSWRPYAENLENWRHPMYYRENEQFFSNRWNLDDDLRLFLQFLQPCELVGVGCKEMYRPHRVAMQFGFDQDLPGDSGISDFGSENVAFFTPPRSLQPGISPRYLSWWRELMLMRRNAIRNSLLLRKSSCGSSLVAEDRRKEDKSQSHSLFPFYYPTLPSSRAQAKDNLMGKPISRDKIYGGSLWRNSKVSVSQRNSHCSMGNLSAPAREYQPERDPLGSRSTTRAALESCKTSVGRETRHEASAIPRKSPQVREYPPERDPSGSRSTVRAAPESYKTSVSREIRHEASAIPRNSLQAREYPLERDPLGSRSTVRAAPEAYKTSISRETRHEFSALPRKSHHGSAEKSRLTSKTLQDSKKPGAFPTYSASSHTEQRTPSAYPAYSSSKADKPVRFSPSDDSSEDRIPVAKRLTPRCNTREGPSRDGAGSGKKPKVPYSHAGVPKQEKRKAHDPGENLKGGVSGTISDEGESDPQKEVRVDLNRKGRSITVTVHLDDVEEMLTTPSKSRRLG